jgi:hypothetical protein
MKNRMHFRAAGVLLALASCSAEDDRILTDGWVTAASLESPSVPYTPKTIVSAREREDGMWIWHPQGAAPEAIAPQLLLRKVAEVKSLRPEPLILYSFAHHADQSALAELKSRVADAAECTSSSPCIEGTPDQLQ